MRNGTAQSPSRLRFALRGALRLSRREIAEMLGLTEETVSRVMADFARKKIIGSGKGYIRILDRKWLEETNGVENKTSGAGRRAQSGQS
ncbi:MAG: helix-turn-helix domain-containing protein [Sulfuricaulis sp.]|nr:helix-turn-helix domain-containing protein [Sulfuricaulis sp.]